MRCERYFDEAIDGLVTHEGVVIERPLLNAQISSERSRRATLQQVTAGP
jgi:hypothetical protein